MFALSWMVTGAVSGYTYQASIFFTLEEISEKGKGSGFHEAIVGSGMCFGPLLAGLVGNHHSLRAPYYFCAWALVFGIALQIAMVALRRKSATVTA
jgi:MFS family permease